MLGYSMCTLPFSTPRDAMLTILVCATRWLSMHLYMLAHMSIHESCLLVCRPCFNTIKLQTFNPNLHVSLADTTVCLLSCFFACDIYHAYLLYASFICFLHLFLPLLVSWFLVFTFACTHMERGCIELGHNIPSASKKGEDASMWI